MREDRASGTASRHVSLHRRFRPAFSSQSCCDPSLEPLEARRLLSGVTLITHGFGGAIDGWVTAMAQTIIDRPNADVDPYGYTLTVTDPGHDGGPIDAAVASYLPGPPLTDAQVHAPEIFILLDWTDLAGVLPFGGYTRSTVDVGDAVVDALLDPDLLADLAGLPGALTELPLHLIGHSRGAALISQIAQGLGEHGVWVDHVTTLDPHPVDGVCEPFPYPDFGDAAMITPETVVFWDNYWRIEQSSGCQSFDFCGEPVAGAADFELDEDLLESAGGYDFEHSDTHLWYHGTIDTASGAFDGEEYVPDDFYLPPNPQRETTGYCWSRPVGGDRPSAGIGQPYGGEGARDAVNHAGSQWADVGLIAFDTDDEPVRPGDVVQISFRYQDIDSEATIELLLDDDRNPFNGDTGVIVYNEILQATGEAVGLHSFSWTAPRLQGTYHLQARIGDGSHTRYAHAATPMTLITWNDPIPPTPNEDRSLIDAADEALISTVRPLMPLWLSTHPHRTQPTALTRSPMRRITSDSVHRYTVSPRGLSVVTNARDRFSHTRVSTSAMESTFAQSHCTPDDYMDTLCSGGFVMQVV
ncbi:MAG: hypothetical protein KAS72_09705 [Phycisphaerales bacterium]|nr:hypothetical protein [Phycisphaerales bacterium]